MYPGRANGAGHPSTGMYSPVSSSPPFWEYCWASIETENRMPITSEAGRYFRAIHIIQAFLFAVLKFVLPKVPAALVAILIPRLLTFLGIEITDLLACHEHGLHLCSCI